MSTDRPDANPWGPAEYAKLAGFDSDWRDSWWSEDYIALLARRWRLSEARSMLDVGCGAGHWGQRLAVYLPGDAELVGVDREAGFVPAAEERARARLGSRRFRYLPGDAEELPFGEGSFDVVTCQTVLMHVASPETALAEMRRVLRPGGLVAVAEPNNMANAMVELSAEPEAQWDTIEALLRFQKIVERGKRLLGEGDSSVGDRLPRLVSEAGFEDVQASTNERCAALFPPYPGDAQQLELNQEIEWMKTGVWAAAGYRDDALRLYTAGGGDAAGFDDLWSLLMEHHRSVRGAMEEGRFSGGRGFVQYIVWARKPA